jgi:phosphoenolpyruvate carboxylase
MNGTGTLKHLESEVVQEKLEKKLAEKLKDFNVLLVLTAHPTQFYPGLFLVLSTIFQKHWLRIMRAR